jgi:hypothetical protein
MSDKYVISVLDVQLFNILCVRKLKIRQEENFAPYHDFAQSCAETHNMADRQLFVS